MSFSSFLAFAYPERRLPYVASIAPLRVDLIVAWLPLLCRWSLYSGSSARPRPPEAIETTPLPCTRFESTQLSRSSFSFDSPLYFLRRSWPAVMVDPWPPRPSSPFRVSGDLADSGAHIKICGSDRCLVYWYVCIFRLPLAGDVLRLLRRGERICLPSDSFPPLVNVRD